MVTGAFPNSLNKAKPVKIEYLILSGDSVNFDLLNHKSAKHQFKEVDFKKIRENTTYLFRLDFEDQLKNIGQCDTILLKTKLLYKAKLFVKGREGIITKDFNYKNTGPFQGSFIQNFSVPVPVNGLIKGRYAYLQVQFSLSMYVASFRGFRYTTSCDVKGSAQVMALWQVKRQLPVFILLGVIAILALFNIVIYVATKDNQYLFYGMFLLFQSLYFSRASAFLSQFLFGNQAYVAFLVVESSEILINLNYLLFTKFFLNTRRNLPKLDKAINFVAFGLITLCAFNLIALLIDPYFPAHTNIMNTQRFFMSIFALIGVIYILIVGKGRLRYFIVAGNVVFVTGALLTLFSGSHLEMIVGSGIENTIFGLGLAYKIRAIHREKIRVQRQANEVKSSALGAQMNPHFLFNSLNSIQCLIMKNDKVSALRYLSSFSHLLRDILESSIKVNIPISKEIEMLKTYIDLESLRFDHSFGYKIEVDQALDIHTNEVPILLIQPYVENAINHGLVAKTTGLKTLTIKFLDNHDYIECTIEDTGIGRKAAMELQSKKNIGRPSRGLSINAQRLQLINENLKLKTLVAFVDSDQGTKVILKIPKH